jgi:hypothetical protein
MLASETRVWLGGLDSNQDNQIQNLMYCQLYDLPAAGPGSLRYFAAPEKASSNRSETAQKEKAGIQTVPDAHCKAIVARSN